MSPAPERWMLFTADSCACCGSRDRLVRHHVCYRAHVRREGGDEWNPANALALATPCHEAHHARRRVLPVSVLRDENIAFAAGLLGPLAAHSYFARYYASTDSRVEALLVEPRLFVPDAPSAIGEAA